MIRVNHVLSSTVLISGIFSDLLHRFAQHMPDDFSVDWSARPDPDADIYHFHRPQREWRLPRRKSVVTVHHDLMDPLPWLDPRRFLPRYREARMVICLNEGQRRFLSERGLSNLTVIPHGADLSLIGAGRTKEPRDGRLRLGFFSRHYLRGVKGEDHLMALLDDLDPAKFTFLLAGEDRHLNAQAIRERGFDCDVVQFPPYRLFAQLYKRIDLLLVLSHHEGGPASLPEALGAGTPVATTPVGMATDFVRDGENGLILTHDPAQTAARLLELAASPTAMETLINGARASTIPDWSDIMARHYDLYRQIASSSLNSRTA